MTRSKEAPDSGDGGLQDTKGSQHVLHSPLGSGNIHNMYLRFYFALLRIWKCKLISIGPKWKGLCISYHSPSSTYYSFCHHAVSAEDSRDVFSIIGNTLRIWTCKLISIGPNQRVLCRSYSSTVDINTFPYTVVHQQACFAGLITAPRPETNMLSFQDKSSLEIGICRGWFRNDWERVMITYIYIQFTNRADVEL